MARNYMLPTIKQLFAEADACAHPECDEPLIFHERGFSTVVADIAHIRSESVDGPRYDETFIGDINSPENLLLLCGKHHRPVDRHEVAYNVKELLEWKVAQVEAARAGGTPISDEQAKPFVLLSAEEGQALAQIARLSERVLSVASRAVEKVEAVVAARDAEVEAFVRHNPVWEVGDDGERTLIPASRTSLPRVTEDRYRDQMRQAVLDCRGLIEPAVDALREEIAVLSMRSGGGLAAETGAVIEAANRVLGNAADTTAAAAVRSSVAALWRAANGDT